MGRQDAKSPVAQGAAPAIVVATQPRRRAKTVLLASLALLLAGALIVTVVVAGRHQDILVDEMNTAKYDTARSDADKLRGAQDYDKAKEVWQSYLDGDASRQDKYKAHLQLGSLDETKGDCEAALVHYREAEKFGVGEWRAENESIARCAEKLGDKQTALAYYQKTLDTFPGGEEYPSDLRFYRTKIASLKQQLDGR